MKSDTLLLISSDCRKFAVRGKALSFFFKIKCRYVYGIADWSYYKKAISEVITLLHLLFYKAKREELAQGIERLEKELSDSNHENAIENFHQISMKYLKAALFSKFGGKTHRKSFTEDDLWKNPSEVMKEYPIVLSTTFSARSSLSKEAEFDYLIMDEASQVDVATGALALSCANNVVIVGDPNQLPNVVTEQNKSRLREISNSYKINRNYDFAEKSFLQSLCDVIPNVPQTLLRESLTLPPENHQFLQPEVL